jgi:hypothetical protein
VGNNCKPVQTQEDPGGTGGAHEEDRLPEASHGESLGLNQLLLGQIAKIL